MNRPTSLFPNGRCRRLGCNGFVAPFLMEVKATPFLKWVGGKRSILHDIISRLPKKFGNYFEPFVGGGALFFEISDRIQKANLSDFNVELVHTYEVVKTRPHKLIDLLEEHAKKHSEKYFYEVREKFSKNKVELAARMIYLNRTCYNGLFRVNREGKFNTPFGKYKNPNII